MCGPCFDAGLRQMTQSQTGLVLCRDHGCQAPHCSLFCCTTQGRVQSRSKLRGLPHLMWPEGCPSRQGDLLRPPQGPHLEPCSPTAACSACSTPIAKAVRQCQTSDAWQKLRPSDSHLWRQGTLPYSDVASSVSMAEVLALVTEGVAVNVAGRSVCVCSVPDCSKEVHN